MKNNRVDDPHGYFCHVLQSGLGQCFGQPVRVFGQFVLSQHSGQILTGKAVAGAGKVLLWIVAAGRSVQQTTDCIVEHVVGEVT